MNSWEAIVAAVVATIFGISAASKALDRGALAPVLRAVGLPDPLAAIVGVVIVPLEAIIALGLLTGAEAASFVAVAATSGFVLIQIAARTQGVNADCRCFGSLAPTRAGSVLAIARSVLLLGASVALASANPLPALADPAVSGLGLALGAATVLAFGLLESVQRFRGQREQLAAQALLETRP